MGRIRLLITALAVLLLIGSAGLRWVRHDQMTGGDGLFGKEALVKALEREGLRITETVPTKRYALFSL